MVMYSFVPPFREAKFCGVLSCVFDKLGSAASEKIFQNTGLVLLNPKMPSVIVSAMSQERFYQIFRWHKIAKI
jgi:hypothetical protein